LKFGALGGFLAYVAIFGGASFTVYQSSPEHAISLIRNSVGTGFSAVVFGVATGWLFWIIALSKPNISLKKNVRFSLMYQNSIFKNQLIFRGLRNRAAQKLLAIYQTPIEND
jgi:hypothetical protein